MHTWSIAHSREGFFLYIEKTPMWAYLLSWPIDWLLSLVNVVPWERPQVMFYRAANRLSGVQDKHLTRIMTHPISDEDAATIDAEFVRLSGDFWDD